MHLFQATSEVAGELPVAHGRLEEWRDHCVMCLYISTDDGVRLGLVFVRNPLLVCFVGHSRTLYVQVVLHPHVERC